MTASTLSSTARRAYWLGRYLERAEATANLMKTYGTLLYDLPQRLPDAWETLISILALQKPFAKAFDEPSERNVCRFLLNDPANPASLLANVEAARENARTLQGVIPRIGYEYINELSLLCNDRLRGVLSRSRRTETLPELMESAQKIHGFLAANMLRDDPWRFYRIGVLLERADMTSRFMDMAACAGFSDLAEQEAFADLRWRSVLRACSAQLSYRRSTAEPISQATVLDFLLNNRDLPSSLRYCLEEIDDVLKALSRHQQPRRSLAAIRRLLRETDLAALDEAGASALLDACQFELRVIGDQLERSYFNPASAGLRRLSRRG
ncbi:MAG: alpha-E domain-containing protein [Pseudomonadota bacterium]